MSARDDGGPDVSDLDGMYIGDLNIEERRRFDAAVAIGRARWSYEGAGGFLGLGKVRAFAARKEPR